MFNYMKDRLGQLTNAGVKVVIWGPHLDYGKGRWQVMLEKTDSDGTKLEIQGRDTDLETAVQEAYDKWDHTTRALPTLSLKQIEYTAPPQVYEGPGEQVAPRELDDEIPF